MLARCTSSLDLHMLIVPDWYLFRTLLVPKVALGELKRYVPRAFGFYFLCKVIRAGQKVESVFYAAGAEQTCQLD